VGSGDIGLIMARRLSWVGSNVLCVVEILPYPSGLTRNIVQCLQDFRIPLHLNHAVTNILGKDRVEAVEICPLANGVPVTEKRCIVPCDTVLLSVGLIPENELSRKAGVRISANTSGPVVDYRLQTNIEGVFACGNVLHVHDLVDYVSEEGHRCGKSVAGYLRGEKPAFPRSAQVVAGANVRYVLPNDCAAGEETHFFMRSLIVCDSAQLTLRQGETVVRTQKLRYVRPAEMISLTLSAQETAGLNPDIPLEFTISS
jgi:hypothetical protein